MRAAALALAFLASASFAIKATAETPKRGGILKFVVGSKIPSYDGHQETTYGMIHPIRPFYSLLIRVNPDNPQSPTDFVCDVCEGEVPAPTDGGLTYTFKIRSGIKFHDGTPLAAADVKATYDKIIFPPDGVKSRRKDNYEMVESVTAPNVTTVVFKLKYPSGAFIPALASPFNFIYSKKDLDTHGYAWHKTNVNGTGAFKFKQHQSGAFVEGVRYDSYHHAGKPYLDGYKAIAAQKMAVRLQAIRGNQAAIEFRGFPPKARDDLVSALGDQIMVQEGDWNCTLLVIFNHKRTPYDDALVRRALTLAIDRWGGSRYFSQITIVKTVGGIVFPNHPLAATTDELQKMAGYWPDIEKSRAEARRLLKEAGQENLQFTLLNRTVDQPYRVVGGWLIDQWKRIGVKATHKVVPSGEWYASLRKKKDFEVAIGVNCNSVVNPLLDISSWLGSASDNYAQYEDPVLEDLFNKMNREGNPVKQRQYMRQFERRALSDMAHQSIVLWWYKIHPHRSYVKGWKTAPSHYLNQHLDQVWLDK